MNSKARNVDQGLRTAYTALVEDPTLIPSTGLKTGFIDNCLQAPQTIIFTCTYLATDNSIYTEIKIKVKSSEIEFMSSVKA